MPRWLRIALLLAMAALAPLPGWGREFRFAFQSDVASLDPHFFDHAFTTGFLGNVYEGLTRWDDQLQVEPALATAWEQESPLSWRFTLRRGVTFHEGQEFTADDVVFSVRRATGPESGFAGLAAAIAEAEALDPYTVRIATKQPYVILPRMLTNLLILSRGWAEANGAATSSNMRTGQRNYAADHANGTGPFRVTRHEPDSITQLAVFPGWWDRPTHNLTVATFRPIKSPPTRVAALLSRQVDMIWPVPLADIPRLQGTPGFKVANRPSEWAIMLRLNQGVERLSGGDQAGNPFRDVRVREAVHRAIDTEAIRRTIMRGLSTTTALPLAPTTNGYTESLQRPSVFDPERAKALLVAAGYPNGFAFTLDCPNDRFINDEAICRAIVPMLARIGLNASLAVRSTTPHFTHIGRRVSDAFLVGWASAGVKDAHNLLSQLFATTSGSLGAVNYAGYSDAELDGLIQAIGGESDAAKRAEMFARALAILQRDWAVIPVHLQPSVWGFTAEVTTLQLPDDNMRLWRTRLR
ncbi:ABC transporter substrate-binding protein [Siccirubricoccus phaeus]|uniref:ABC transporter substrate-binding protein n=1 Tax=Siccirubricoccus phaeus TaxID=2595053 RepID=UPI0011F1B45E|nr:ABC transporter substrate-binding protein [Siccirubricoccus phaeus]